MADWPAGAPLVFGRRSSVPAGPRIVANQLGSPPNVECCTMWVARSLWFIPEASENQAKFFIDVDGTPENMTLSCLSKPRW